MQIEAPLVRSSIAADDAVEPTRSISLPRWTLIIAASDLACAAGASALAVGLRFRDQPGPVAGASGISYVLVASVFPILWVAALLAGGAYDRRSIATGHEEFRRALNVTVWLTSGIAFTSFALHVDLSRAFVAITLPVALGLTCIFRYIWRRRIHTALASGQSVHRALVVGGMHEARDLVVHMQRAPYAGFHVVGIVVPTATNETPRSIEGRPVFTIPLSELVERSASLGANAIVLAGSSAAPGRELRRLSWRLEGTGIDLIVAPSVADFAGPRIVVRPVQGLPLLHVDEPEFRGAKRVLKEATERVAAALMLALLSPLFLVIALASRYDSHGPVLFRQRRIGLNGTEFTLFKFRTMLIDAEARRIEVLHLNERDGVHFKLREDPRVTRVGRFLRRHSLDEMPQLWNVLTGSMSLVGPRPPLASEVERFDDGARRRLLVKPGMTGLWQVSGRADLSWEESVRLDLYYIENWSITLDAMVLWRTLAAVLHGRGAY